MLRSCIKGFLRAKKLWVNPPKAERAKPSLSSDYNLLFKNKIGESSLDIHRTVAVNLTGAVDISAFSTNSKGIYAVGQNVQMDVGEDGKTTKIVATGKGGQGIMTDTGAVLNVKGRSITVRAEDESGRGIAA